MQKIKTYTTNVEGLGRCKAIAAALIEKSQWFEFEPYPDDWWRFTVKHENMSLLDMLVTRDEKPQTIIVTMDGGVIQNIEGIPVGVEIDVQDFDVEDLLDEDYEFLTDGSGHQYTSCVWYNNAEGGASCR